MSAARRSSGTAAAHPKVPWYLLVHLGVALALVLAPGCWVGIGSTLESAAGAAATAPAVPVAERRSAAPGRLQPSWQVDGRVMAIRIKGDLVIVGGEFEHAIGPRGRRIPARNLAVFAMSTGRLIAGAVPGTDGVVRALATRGRWLWVGGYFEFVGGVPRPGLAKVDLRTGKVAPGFDARLDHGVQALALRGAGLYAGGRMTTSGGVAQGWLTRLNSATGRLDEAFRPQLDGPVFALATDRFTDRVWAGGAFEHVQDLARDSIVALDPATGLPSGRQLARTGGDVLSLQVAARGRRVLLADSFNVLCSWSARTGRRQWRIAAGGDVQAVRVRGHLAYFGVHGGFAGNRRAKLLVAAVRTGRVRAWRPAIPDYWGIYALDANRRGLVAGGRITRVGGVSAQGWARFVS